MLQEELERRNIPALLRFADQSGVTADNWRARRQEMLDILCRDEYGFLPPAPSSFHAETVSVDERFCAGKASLAKVLLTSRLPGGDFTFPVYAVFPRSGRPCPAFVHINFRDAVPDKYMPSEEICDAGFAVLSFCYQDITADNDDFSSGLAGELYHGKPRTGSSCGKIAMWAWAAMRAMDYLQTQDAIDLRNIAVVGHSRLGKTALLAGALDERFAFVISNDSGCSGAALSRGKIGETVRDICKRFPFWLCENYRSYIDRENEMPFDQHFLLASAAPRYLYVASAEEDTWADPRSEYLSCVAASDAYKLLGLPGLVCPDRYPVPGDVFHEGRIGYHLRTGCHYFSRYDWQRYMEFIMRHRIPAS